MNHLAVLLEFFPEEKWKRNDLSVNPNMTIFIARQYNKTHTPLIDYNDFKILYAKDLQVAHKYKWRLDNVKQKIKLSRKLLKQKKWKLDNHLFSNPSFPIDMLVENLTNKQMNWYIASERVEISIILDTIDKYGWYMSLISANPSVRLNHVLANKTLEWNWVMLSRNVGITMTEIKNTKDTLPWNWYQMSCRPDLEWELIISVDPNKWNWRKLSKHNCVTWPIIRDNITTKNWRDKPRLESYVNWDWYKITANPNITWDIIRQNPNYPWEISYFAANINISISIIRENRYIGWNWNVLSLNPTFRAKDIIDNKDLPWQFQYISMNKFNLSKYMRTKWLSRIYFSKWRDNIRKRNEYKRALFVPVMDLYKLRLRDIEMGNRVDLLHLYDF